MAAADDSPCRPDGRIPDGDQIAQFLMAATNLYRAAVMMHLSVDDGDVAVQQDAVAKLMSLADDADVIHSLSITAVSDGSFGKNVADAAQVGQSLVLRLRRISHVAADSSTNGCHVDDLVNVWPPSDVVFLRQALQDVMTNAVADGSLSSYVFLPPSYV